MAVGGVLQNGVPYPETRLSYQGNVLNPRAEAFYRRHGVTRIDPKRISPGSNRSPRVITSRPVRQAFPRPVASVGSVQPLSEVEKQYILAVLELNGGNQTRSAKQLQIGSATLYRKLKKYGVIGESPDRTS